MSNLQFRQPLIVTKSRDLFVVGRNSVAVLPSALSLS